MDCCNGVVVLLAAECGGLEEKRLPKGKQVRERRGDVFAMETWSQAAVGETLRAFQRPVGSSDGIKWRLLCGGDY